MSLRHLILVSAAALLTAAGVNAAPLQYAPSAGARGAELEVGGRAAYEQEVGLDLSLISARAARALMVSETRTRALAEGAGAPRSGRQVQGVQGAQGRKPRRQAYASFDPVVLALERLTSRPHADGSEGAAEHGAARLGVEEVFADGEALAMLGDEEEVTARAANVSQAFSDALGEAIPLDFTVDGQVVFNLMMLGGFSASAARGQMSMMFQDVTLATSGSAGVGPGARSARPHGLQTPAARAEQTLKLRLLFLVWDTLTHPLTLALLVVLGVFRLVAGLTHRGPAY